MKLISVDNVLKISIEKEELTKYMTALDKVLVDVIKIISLKNEISILKSFSTELAKILHSASDY